MSNPTRIPKRPFSRPTVNTVNIEEPHSSKPTLIVNTVNIEGLSSNKETLLGNMCNDTNCDILVIQETHRGSNSNRPNITGMILVNERSHEKYGSAIFTKPDIPIITTAMTCEYDIEILTIELQSCTITSVYKPPAAEFIFTEPSNFQSKNIKIVLGDFNSHSINWGYNTTDENGEKLEAWAEQNNLTLIHDPKLPSSFNSGRWRRGYNPDNIFVSNAIARQTVKKMSDPIPHTQHRTITCQFKPVVEQEIVSFKRRFNFKKARWNDFASDLDRQIESIEPIIKSYEHFVEVVKKVSRKHIPRGCRTNYIAGLDENSKSFLTRYEELYENDPFSDETLEAGEALMESISESRSQKWMDLLENLDMKQNSRRAWRTVKNLSNDPTTSKTIQSNVTANQVAHQLLLNGKTIGKCKKLKITRDTDNENNSLEDQFTIGELELAIKEMKSNKAPGMDDLRIEQIKEFGPRTLNWILQLMNNCIRNAQIPKMWRKAKVVAILKPGKDPEDPKSFRPISLLCQLFKILERMVLNRISSSVDDVLVKEQAGFRPGKSCTGQVLNITQHIEDGYERGEITGVAFIDLSAAYDTINHNRLIYKVYNTTKDYSFTSFLKCILQNRRFYVQFQNKRSRWRNQKNGLQQGSVLAPLLYNIFSNDQPITSATKQFRYADDTAVLTQAKTFIEIESNLTRALEELEIFYNENHLRPNPSKTQVCAYHLRNREAKRKLHIIWQGQALEHSFAPKYLGVTLDRSLTYKTQCETTKKKISTRNNLIRKLTGSQWGAKPHVLRTSALALCFSTAEYAAPVWGRSAHSKEVDTAINETVRITTGCLRPTPLDKVYPLIGIAPPSIRREVCTNLERSKQEDDSRHPMFNYQHHHPSRLKSRKSFLKSSQRLTTTPEEQRLKTWKEEIPNPIIELEEEIAAGGNLPFNIWRPLNRLRVGVARCRSNLRKWNLTEDDTCLCGEVQDMPHLLTCPDLDETCTLHDLIAANDVGIRTATHWRNI